MLSGVSNRSSRQSVCTSKVLRKEQAAMCSGLFLSTTHGQKLSDAVGGHLSVGVQVTTGDRRVTLSVSESGEAR